MVWGKRREPDFCGCSGRGDYRCSTSGFSGSISIIFDQTLLEENQSHLAEVADHIVTYIQAAVEDTLDTLETAADALPLMEQEECVGYLKQMVDRHGFT